jgi:hypothetical protein
VKAKDMLSRRFDNLSPVRKKPLHKSGKQAFTISIMQKATSACTISIDMLITKKGATKWLKMSFLINLRAILNFTPRG